MSDAKLIEVRRWLIKSRHDIGSAQLLLDGDPPYLDTAVYHCEQAVEKALKGFLTYHDVVFSKTYDLTALVEQCVVVESSFDA